MQPVGQIDPHFERNGEQGDYEIAVRSYPMTDVPKIILDGNGLIECSFLPIYRPQTTEEEERGLSQQDIQSASLCFARTRARVTGALQALAAYVFREFDIPRRNGLDIGSGGTGAMLGSFIRPFIGDNLDAWAHSDVNPAAAASIRNLYPRDRVLVGSYLSPASMLTSHYEPGHKFDVVTGLSSLDATYFPERAISEMRNMLKAGGFLVHIQDVRPGQGYSFRELAHMGYEPPFVADSIPGERNNDGNPKALMFHTPGYGNLWRGQSGAVSVGDLFRMNLGRAIEQTPGMELLLNHWVTARREVESNVSQLYYMNIVLGGIPDLHQYLGRRPFEEASAIVTVARKAA